jgi:Tol biopolymer transport system component
VYPEPSPPPLCGTNCGKIVFVSNRDGSDEIYTCNAGGSNVTRLTNDPAWDKQPVWSPDGTKIAFVKDFLFSDINSIGSNIYIMNADGSNVVQLTFTGYAGHPAWSPDGTKIAFTSGIDATGITGVLTIKIVNSSNGSVLVQTGMYGASFIPDPAWSPDGTKIAFDTDIIFWDVISAIFTICPNGGNQNPLTTQYGIVDDYWKPAWSPNGSKLSVTIFEMGYQGGATPPASIGVMNPDGTGLTVIISGNMGGHDVVTKTSWSPDGESITYTSWGTNNTKTIKWIAANGSGASGTIITNGWDADWKH